MKERPILFSSPMVRAILDGRKTQTRRVVKPQPESVHDGEPYWHVGGYRAWQFRGIADLLRIGTNNPLVCPYGQPGDRLWVRETMEVSYQGSAYYAADGAQIGDRDELGDLCERYGHPYFFNELKGIPSIHMPRWASRITLEVTGVRVERLLEISESDAQAEGIDLGGFRSGFDGIAGREHTIEFHSLWESINGPGSWDANPWVWVVEFRRL